MARLTPPLAPHGSSSTRVNFEAFASVSLVHFGQRLFIVTAAWSGCLLQTLDLSKPIRRIQSAWHMERLTAPLEPHGSSSTRVQFKAFASVSLMHFGQRLFIVTAAWSGCLLQTLDLSKPM